MLAHWVKVEIEASEAKELLTFLSSETDCLLEEMREMEDIDEYNHFRKVYVAVDNLHTKLSAALEEAGNV
jgi:hypothetical protein